jgi:hypothetical protein
VFDVRLRMIDVASRQGVGVARVVLRDRLQRSLSLRSDEAGLLWFRNVPLGSYSLEVLADGYRPLNTSGRWCQPGEGGLILELTKEG